MPHILANYHTHTARCNHATGSEEDYIRTAIRQGFQVLGFADHAPWNYSQPGFVSRIRMKPSELEDYASTLRRLQTKYADKLHLYIGLEAEYFPAYLDDLLAEKQRLGLDYLILGCHYDLTDETGMYFGRASQPEHLELYAHRVISGMETGAYLYLAHPDLCFNHYSKFDETAQNAAHAICQAAARLDIPLEYNLPGAVLQPVSRARKELGYACPEFWQVAAQYPVKAIIGCDAHAPDELARVPLIQQSRQFLEGLGLTVLETLPGLE